MLATTVTFKAVFVGLSSVCPFNDKTSCADSFVGKDQEVRLYETTKHGEATYSVISSEISPMDSLPIRFIITIDLDGSKLSRIIDGSESINFEYKAGREPNRHTFVGTSTSLRPAVISSTTSNDYANEAVEAFKVGAFINKLEQMGDWNSIVEDVHDGLGDWVELERPEGHTVKSWNGWTFVDGAKRGIH